MSCADVIEVTIAVAVALYVCALVRRVARAREQAIREIVEAARESPPVVLRIERVHDEEPREPWESDPDAWRRA